MNCHDFLTAAAHSECSMAPFGRPCVLGIVYLIYFSKLHGDIELGRLLYECHNRDETARRCIALFCTGYKVHKVVLPNGDEIHGVDIEYTLKAAVLQRKLRWETISDAFKRG